MLTKVKQFFSDVKLEIKKVVFPQKDELIGSTWVVIVVVVVISFYLGAVDIGLAKIVKALLQ